MTDKPEITSKIFFPADKDHQPMAVRHANRVKGGYISINLTFH
jgi:hypothetical protein